MKTIVSLLFVALFVSGCASYQSSFEVAGNKIKMPKDAVVGYLRLELPSTNGPIVLVITNSSFRMNPSVLNAATAHDVAVIGAVGSAVGQAAGTAAKVIANP